jgi:hypothetical protein
MCEPATLTALGMSAANAAAVSSAAAAVGTAVTAASPYLAAASAVGGYIQQDRQADAQEEAIKVGMQTEANQLNLQQQQMNQQASEKMSALALESLRETGRLKAITGDAGAAGLSSVRGVNEVLMNEGTDMASLEANRKNAINQSVVEGQGAIARGMSQINSIKRPSLIGTGLQIAGSYADQQAGKQNTAAQTQSMRSPKYNPELASQYKR